MVVGMVLVLVLAAVHIDELKEYTIGGPRRSIELVEHGQPHPAQRRLAHLQHVQTVHRIQNHPQAGLRCCPRSGLEVSKLRRASELRNRLRIAIKPTRGTRTGRPIDEHFSHAPAQPDVTDAPTEACPVLSVHVRHRSRHDADPTAHPAQNGGRMLQNALR